MGDESCPKEYGNPSGHSMFAPAFGGLILLDILTSNLNISELQNAGLAVASFVFYFVMGYCRFILGVHALNQVLFGFALGIWLAVSYHLMVKNLFFNYVIYNI